MYFFKKLLISIKNALIGLKDVFFLERNFKIMFFSLFSVSVFILNLSFEFWEIIIIISIGVLMLVVELINTAIEKTLNLISKHHNDSIRYIKDMMAGASLLVSILWLFLIFLFFYK